MSKIELHVGLQLCLLLSFIFVLSVNGAKGDQDVSPQNMALQHNNYFELKAIKNRQM